MQTATMTSPTPAKKQSAFVLTEERFGEAELNMRTWIAFIPSGITEAQLLDPGSWSMCAARLTSYDKIECRADDGSWIITLRVQFSERNFAKVVVESRLDFPENAESLSAPSVRHKVEHKGTFHKWSVIRLSDNEMLKSGLKTREEANLWLIEHEKSTRQQ